MVEDKKKQETAPSGWFATKTVLLAAAVVLLAIGAYFVWQGNETPPAPPTNQSTSQIDTPMAKILLSAYENGGKLKEYYLKYMMNDSGVESGYEVGSNGSDQWVVLSGDFGAVEGYFGNNSTQDLACLSYGGVKKCGRIRNDTQTGNIAATLKSYLPNEKIYGEQEAFVRKLIDAGAIRFTGGLVDEKVGDFNTQKVTYALNYKNLTVDKLLGLDVSPTSPEVVSRTGQEITMWIDKQTNLVVRSLATYRENGVGYTYETLYYNVSLEAPAVPVPHVSVVDSETFARFYQDSMADYGAKQLCFEKAGMERDLCLKNLAVDKLSWDMCKMISDSKTYEQCTLIVAQDTNNPILCEKLAISDECYIAIASETGNFELCKNLKNASLIGNCNDAAVDGARKLAVEAERVRRLAESRNCAADSDCGVKGNANQYCVPKNDSRTLSNEASQLYACLAGVPCGCDAGFCGFKKNDTYYNCTSAVETGLTETFIQGLVAQANSTNGSK